MPPKGKGPKSDFLQCDACGVIVASKDAALHERVCSRCKFEGEKLEHDFIHDGVLHGTLQDYPGDETLTLPEWMKSQLLYLHPSCMKMCNTGIKDVVEVSQEGQTHLLIAWPSTNVGLTCVAMPKRFRTSKSKAVTIKRHCSSIVAASSVTVMSTQDTVKESDASLQKCLLQQNMGIFTKPGSSMQCCFYGQILNFEVIETQGEDGLSLKSPSRLFLSHNDDSLGESMKRLSIHEELSGDHSFRATSMSPRSRTPRKNVSWSVHSPVAFSTPKSLLHRQCESEKVTFHRIRSSTDIIIKSADEQDSERRTSAGYDHIGGLDKEIQQLRELFEVPLKHPGTFARFGLKPPRGALLFGPPGTGKTMLARAVAAESKAALIVIDGPQIFSKYYGETEATLRSLFKDASERAPSIVFIDEIDALCPKRESGTSNQEARAVATLVSLIDSLPLVEDKWVLVLGATNRPNFVDPSLRQPGRLDREIEIGVPTAHGRQQILQKILSNVNHSLSIEDITEIADVAHGLTGADLAAVCADAALRALERNIASKNTPDATLSKVVQLTKADMATALRHTKPSAMREVALEIPKVRWSDIGGMKEVKLKLQQVVEWPWKHRDAFIRLGVTPPCGVLLYGPPGCSKTMIAKALATESGLNFIAIKGPELFSKWVGDSERAVRDLFRKARAASPCIIFFDEIDALAVHRGSTSGSSNVGDRVIAQLLTEMDGIEKLEDVILVAATNRPDMIDQALMRPGRLDSIVYVPLPDVDTRKEILHLNLSKKPLGNDVDIEDLASKTNGYSGAEVVAVCQEAALLALEEDINATCVEGRHLEAALKLVQPRISPESVKFYESYWASSQSRHTSKES
ncbi:ATPase family protein 2 homolog [Rhipicephalus sanguineus]|uniref:ATPase family protein 2 homolog n=1 Tax=Rhipicephalus sanguineus TaxID=34632 RepID=UPI001894A521|nr:ATPase family protein 2 homolog [Rhipicephalus sanguineus]